MLKYYTEDVPKWAKSFAHRYADVLPDKAVEDLAQEGGMEVVDLFNKMAVAPENMDAFVNTAVQRAFTKFLQKSGKIVNPETGARESLEALEHVLPSGEVAERAVPVVDK